MRRIDTDAASAAAARAPRLAQSGTGQANFEMPRDLVARRRSSSALSRHLTIWRIRYNEARAHASIAIGIMALSLITLYSLPGARYAQADVIKGGDFICFYTMASFGWDFDFPVIDDQRIYARQVAMVPASEGDEHPIAYPPTTALVLSPLSLLSYWWALAFWSALTVGAYALTAWVMWRDSGLGHPAFVRVAVTAFPPIWILLFYGQSTLLPLTAFMVAWLAMRDDRNLLAGLAFGLLALKPQFGLVIACVALVTGSWRLLLGMVVSVSAQVGVVSALFGWQTWLTYAESMRRLPAARPFMEAQPWRMHSLKTVTDLLPAPLSTVAWVVFALATIAAVTTVWRSRADPAVKFGTLVLGSVLVNPHLFVYDTVLLVIPLLLIGGWVERARPRWRLAYWQATYFLCVCLLIPTAMVVKVQASVLLMAWMLWLVTHETYAGHVILEQRLAEEDPCAPTRLHRTLTRGDGALHRRSRQLG